MDLKSELYRGLLSAVQLGKSPFGYYYSLHIRKTQFGYLQNRGKGKLPYFLRF
jgi:hypothetical protein